MAAISAFTRVFDALWRPSKDARFGRRPSRLASLAPQGDGSLSARLRHSAQGRAEAFSIAAFAVSASARVMKLIGPSGQRGELLARIDFGVIGAEQRPAEAEKAGIALSEQ